MATIWRLGRQCLSPIVARGEWIRARTLSAAAVYCSSDKVTHTGQAFADDDYRKVRFIDRTKQVNDQFAIDLVAEEPIALVHDNHIWCNGGGLALGHPKVYINLDKPEIGVCGYCGKRFLESKHKDHFNNEKFLN